MNAIAAFRFEFDRHRLLMEQAMQPLSDDDFFRRPAEQVNSIALIVKHLAGNLASRWSDFLVADGDKPWRDRESEFVLEAVDTRENLMAAWDRAWRIVDQTLAGLDDADLRRAVTIRGEPHTVLQALTRGATHAAYHAGQALYLARLWRPDAPWLTIAPGKSDEHRGGYLGP